MSWLKQSTAITVKLGPFVDETDGKTAETGLTIAQADVRLSKNGGDLAQKSSATSCTHDEIGVYDCPLDTTDTGTLGRLDLFVHESGALPVYATFMIVPANVWDSLFGADKLQVHADEITAGLITAAAIATGAIDADAVASDAVTEIQSGLATAAALQTVDDLVDDLETRLTATRAGYLDNLSTGAVATAAALATVSGYVDTEVATVLAAVDTEVAAIKAKTDNLPAAPAATGDIPSAATIADAIWDEARSGHVGAGSFGEGVVVNSIATGAITASAIAADAIGASELAADAATEIGTAVWATAARTLTAATNVTSTGAAVPITAGGLVSADVTAISTDTTAANNAESFFDGTGYAGTNNVIPTVTTATNVTTVNGLAAGVITAAAIATNAIDADALAADAVTEIQSGLATAAGIAALNNLSAAQVNAEVVDALATDTYAEPSSVPAATSSLKDKINWLFTMSRNKRLTTATTDKVRNDADSADVASATLVDDGTTLTRGEYV